MTEKGINHDITALTDSDLQKEFRHDIKLMQETDPEILAPRIQNLTAEMSQIDQELVSDALEFIKPLYAGKKRRYSDTSSILHPYRLALAGDRSAGYKIAINLLHDVFENFPVTADDLREHFRDSNKRPEVELIIKGIDAYTRRRDSNTGEKEDYNTYVTRLKKTAQDDARLTFIIGDKVTDMVQNCLDPIALPSHIERKIPTGKEGRIDSMLEKYSLGGAVLLSKTDARFRKLRGAIKLCRLGQSNNLKLKAA